MKIYLSDLSYDTIKTTKTIPLNVAYIAANLESRFGFDVEIKLFKDPKHLEQAILEAPPDVLGLSHYSWNSRLDNLFSRKTKLLNPDCITVLGGPHIRTDDDGICDFLTQNRQIDHYVMFEGEKPFADLIELALGGGDLNQVAGCASICDGQLVYDRLSTRDFSKRITTPSPFLTGWLDPFIVDHDLIPAFETNRGCPYGCVFCAWGIAALSKLRQRDHETILEEFRYVAEHSSGQPSWIICDANFGILDRDVEFAEEIRRLKSKHGNPVIVSTWAAKNTPDSNFKIAKTLGSVFNNLVAIQSADEDVLDKSGRGAIKLDRLLDLVGKYHDDNMETRTDVLIGLPGETADSHLKTLRKAFDLGFDVIGIYNIRMLPGSELENEDYRKRYAIRTKVRPLFGAYGTFFDEQIMEIDESIRSTVDISETELNSFKVIHWLIFFSWNLGSFKPHLRFGIDKGVNPVDVFHDIVLNASDKVLDLFEQIRDESMSEWFDSEFDLVSACKSKDYLNKLTNEFSKLTFKYIALLYQDDKLFNALSSAICGSIIKLSARPTRDDNAKLNDIQKFSKITRVSNPLERPHNQVIQVSSDTISYALPHGVENLPEDPIMVEVERTEESVNFCRHHLTNNGSVDLSTQNLIRFLETGACFEHLNKKVRILKKGISNFIRPETEEKNINM